MKVVEIHWASSPRKRPAHAIRIDEGATICGVNLVYSDPYRTLRVHEGEPTCGQCQQNDRHNLGLKFNELSAQCRRCLIGDPQTLPPEKLSATTASASSSAAMPIQ